MIKTLLLTIFLQLSSCIIVPTFNLQNSIYYYGVTPVKFFNYYLGFCIAGGMDGNNNVLQTINCVGLGIPWLPSGSLSIPRVNPESISVEKYQLSFFAGGSNVPIGSQIFYDNIDILNWNTFTLTTSSLSNKYQKMSSTSIPNIGLVFFSGLISSNPILSGIDIYNITTGNISTTLFPNLFIAYITADISKNNIIMYGSNSIIDKEYIIIYDFISNKTTNIYSNKINTVYSLTYLPDKNIIVSVLISTLQMFDLNTKNTTIINIPYSNTKLTVPRISYNGLIFLAGGVDVEDTVSINPTNRVQIYDINTRVWSFNFLTEPVLSPYSFYLNELTINTLYFIGGMTYFTFLSPTTVTAGFSKKTNMFSSCKEGTFETNNFKQCSPCTAGFYCPAGSFQEEITTTITYRVCPQGTYCPQNSSAPINCQAGTYNFNFMSTSINDCLSCPAGTFNVFAAQKLINDCVKCDLGTICKEKSTIPLPCPSNYYCPQPTEQIPCPAGTYYNDNNAISVNSCISCDKGFYCSGNGQGSSPCNAGSYSDKTGSSKCDVCPEGFYCQFGTSTPLPCQKNFYAPKGSAGCTPCADGEFTKGIGSASCLICPASKFSVDGWWCMTTYERMIFVGVWLASIISGSISLWKTYSLIKKRFQKIKDYGYVPTIRTFLFLEKMNRRNVNLTQVVDDKPFLQDDQLRRMQYIIDKLQAKMDLIESNSRS